jgi:hypothetical protein
VIAVNTGSTRRLVAALDLTLVARVARSLGASFAFPAKEVVDVGIWRKLGGQICLVFHDCYRMA